MFSKTNPGHSGPVQTAKALAGNAIDFHPKLFKALRSYNAGKLKSDVTAGIVVGIVALPLAIAFGIASGVSPTIGLITATPCRSAAPPAHSL